jgi:glycosyltransferase involved in cell wall biosynthesis
MSAPIRVLHIYKDYSPVVGGIENHLRLLAERQAAMGLDVTVLVTSRTRSTELSTMNGVRIIKAARIATPASTPISPSLAVWIARLRPDIAHLQFPYPVGEAANLLLGRARRTVISYQSDVVRQQGWLRLYQPLLWRVLRRADCLIASTPNYVETSPYLSHLRDKVAVIPLGIEPGPFLHPSPLAQNIRERHGGALLLFVGRLRYYKGLDWLIRAMPRIRAKLLVVGTGPMEAAWRALVSEMGVQDRVVFIGDATDEDLPGYYQACDVFLLPASERSEAYGLVQLEAMAAARPVVCTELGTGTSYINRHGETGLVVPPKSADALVDACNRLLSDEPLRQRMGTRARERVLDEFSAGQMVDRIVSLYQRLLE